MIRILCPLGYKSLEVIEGEPNPRWLDDVHFDM